MPLFNSISVCLCVCVHLIFKPYFPACFLHIMPKMALTISKLTCLLMPEERVSFPTVSSKVPGVSLIDKVSHMPMPKPIIVTRGIE